MRLRPPASLLPSLVVMLLATTSLCSAQGWTTLPPVTGVQQEPSGVELTAGAARISVTAVADGTVRVRVAPDGHFSTEPSWAVIAKPQAVKVTVSDSPSAVAIQLPSGSVRISKNPFGVTFLDATGAVISQDDPTMPVAYHGKEFRVYKTMPIDEHYLGLGDKPDSIDHRDHAYTLWNTDAYKWQEATDPLYKTIPFFIGVRAGRCYGIFLDDTWRSFWDFGKASRDRIAFGAEGGELDYYFFFGPDPKQVEGEYAQLTGTAPLPPYWSLGYQQSRYSYFPESRVREVVNTFRAKKIPLDAIYLDIDYQSQNRPFTIDRQRFPHFEQMIADFKKQGVSVIAITDLHLKKEPGYKPYDEGMAGDDFVHNPDGSVFSGKVWPGESVFPDFTLSRTRAWWGTLYKDFVADGIRGFWNDMDEPSVFERLDKTMPLDTVHRLDDGTKLDHRAVHNVFGQLNSRATYEGMLRLQPNERPNVLTRATYAGGQRYAASWTGDNSSTWNHYRMTLPSLMDLGISGFPNVGVDVGGYAGSPEPDLLTRWLELGTFIPIERDHTEKGSKDQEPWVHGPVHEAIRKRYIEMRYRLLPYIYTSFEETSRTGVPLMRPILFDYPQAPIALALSDTEFLFGSDLLVAPPMPETVDEAVVQLPTGGWFDFWSGRQLKGDSITNQRKLDFMPVYVRPGTVLPMQPVIQSTAEVPQGPMQLRVYPGPGCKGSLYSDDGHTFNYQHGEFARTSFTCTADATGLTLNIGKTEGSFVPWYHEFAVQIFGATVKPARVIFAGKPVTDFSYDAASQTISATIPYARQGGVLQVK